jgi:hypothetical protein
MRDSLKPIDAAFGNKLSQGCKVAARTAACVTHMPRRRDPDPASDPGDVLSQSRAFPRQVAMNSEEGIPIHAWLLASGLIRLAR